jgi:hypothetical protein
MSKKLCMACREPLVHIEFQYRDDCPWCRDKWDGPHQHWMCACRVPYSRPKYARRSTSYRPPAVTERLYMVRPS